MHGAGGSFADAAAAVVAELAAQIADQAFDYLDGPIMRVAAADVPSPCHKNLFEAVEPSARKVQQALEKLIRY